MVINKCDSVDRLPLDDGPIPDRPHVESGATIPCFFEVVVQGDIEQTELHVYQYEAGVFGERSQDEGTRRTCVPRALT